MTLRVTNKLKEFFHRKILYGNFFNLYMNIKRSILRVYKRRLLNKKNIIIGKSRGNECECESVCVYTLNTCACSEFISCAAYVLVNRNFEA